MNGVCRGSAAVTERREVTVRGYRRFRCRACLPSDVTAFAVFCRSRYRLTLRDLSEIMALRRIKISHEVVRDWAAKLLPVVGDALRRRRHRTRRGCGSG